MLSGNVRIAQRVSRSCAGPTVLAKLSMELERRKHDAILQKEGLYKNQSFASLINGFPVKHFQTHRFRHDTCTEAFTMHFCETCSPNSALGRVLWSLLLIIRIII